MLHLVQTINSYLSDYVLVILLMLVGLWYSIRTRFIQIRCFGEGIRSVFGNLSLNGKKHEKGMSSFQALATAIAAQVGTGNIVGASGAILTGGPGAIFWMWVSAVVGMATKFFEGTVAVMYKGKDDAGETQGGPMYMIMEGLGRKWKPMAVFFSIFGLFGTLCIMQSNQLTESITTLFVAPEQNTALLRLFIGLAITAIVAFVVIGGIQRISKIATKLVPTMVALYFLLVIFILIRHASFVPGVIRDIFVGAFTPRGALGGGIGSIIMIALTGVRRAALVNEAGVGTASMMHGASRNSEPVREGLVAMIGPSIDSGLVCTLTALAILIGAAIDPSIMPAGSGMGSMEGLKFALNAFNAAIPGVGGYLLFVMVILFAFSTMFSYSYYGQKCTGFLFGARYSKYYNYFFLAMLIVAAVIPLKVAVSMIDAAYALMAFPTMLTLFLLAPKARKEMDKYFSKTKKERS